MALQMVELHYQEKPQLEFPAIKARTEEILGEEVDVSDESGPDGPLLIFHRNHMVTFEGGAQVPTQTALLVAKHDGDLEKYADDIQQSWSCDDPESLLSGSQHTLLITDFMADGVEPDLRARLLHGVLQAVIELTRPHALVFKHAQQVVAAESYLAALDRPPFARPGAVNVRFYNISNSEGEMIMDTRGLHEIGLHDLQCHFRDLDPNQVSGVLFDTAMYICENGPVIESGHTVKGVADDDRWVCQFEESLLEPKRDVLDLNPGSPHAAGNR